MLFTPVLLMIHTVMTIREFCLTPLADERSLILLMMFATSNVLFQHLSILEWAFLAPLANQICIQCCSVLQTDILGKHRPSMEEGCMPLMSADLAFILQFIVSGLVMLQG